ncbi:N-methyl-L-tryptophan oxidase [Pantoea cypripedii]|uniref:N-methyl-L-tryptophan oxidase n=1 Tax=Pantoea cypripedii TaxID=55209 RepID=A0A6B9GGC7_PANCY|nr:N-methyl-L-tryptophan oxidase [Pantoea cypripedii]QGY32595.1 N-methyl-L-tryptophan oxidase [Pantoea cypripedii]
MSDKYDVAVIGLGALGAASLWRLAEMGARVVGIDQFVPPHALGATHGKTRLFRTFCLEHPALSDYAGLSRQLFASLDPSLLHLTGGLMIGLPDSQAVAGTLQAAQRAGTSLEVISGAELARRQPQHLHLRKDEIAVIDPYAGVAHPEAFVQAALQRAISLGARVVNGTRVTEARDCGNEVHVTTATGTLIADQVVIAGGAWLKRFAPRLPLDPIRTLMTWFEAVPHYALADFPVFVREIDAQLTLWGHGYLSGGDVKLGLGDIGVPRQALDPDNMDRGVGTAESAETLHAVQQWLGGISPQPIRVDPCMITRTPDAQFVAGRYEGRVLVAGGDSGHAFKHAPAVGEVIARLASGRVPELDVDFINPQRFF